MLTKCLAALFRFKSRKQASSFWKWKFAAQLPTTTVPSKLISLQSHHAGEHDAEIDELQQKYKHFFKEAFSGKGESSGVDSNADAMATDENLEDGDEAVISHQKKKEFEQPVQYAGPEKRDYDFNGDEPVEMDPTKKPDDGTTKPQIFY